MALDGCPSCGHQKGEAAKLRASERDCSALKLRAQTFERKLSEEKRRLFEAHEAIERLTASNNALQKEVSELHSQLKEVTQSTAASNNDLQNEVSELRSQLKEVKQPMAIVNAIVKEELPLAPPKRKRSRSATSTATVSLGEPIFECLCGYKVHKFKLGPRYNYVNRKREGPLLAPHRVPMPWPSKRWAEHKCKMKQKSIGPTAKAFPKAKAKAGPLKPSEG